MGEHNVTLKGRSVSVGEAVETSEDVRKTRLALVLVSVGERR